MLTTLAAKQRAGLKAFHITYKTPWLDDERRYASKVATALGIDLEIIEADPDTFPELIPTMVRHMGQPVALVVAEKLYQARDAAEAIEVEYDTLPDVVDARAAMEPGAPQLFDHIPRNIVFDWDNDTFPSIMPARIFPVDAIPWWLRPT